MNVTLVMLDNMKIPKYDKILDLTLINRTHRSGQGLKMIGSYTIVQAFTGTSDTNNRRTKCKFASNVPTIGVSEEMLG